MFKKKGTQGKSFRSRDESEDLPLGGETGKSSTGNDDVLFGAFNPAKHCTIGSDSQKSPSTSLAEKRPFAKVDVDSNVTAAGGESSITTVYAANRSTTLMSGIANDFATRTNDIDTAAERDARAIAERNIHVIADKKTGAAPVVTYQDASGNTVTAAVYQGKGAYQTFTGDKSVDSVGANKMSGTQGPVRAPTFIRSTTFFDYKPDICKDYKETGFCGYGDSCKFLHDRGDYKSGWQLEKEWDSLQAKKKAKLERAILAMGSEGAGGADANEDEEQDELAALVDEELPFACFICRDTFKNPVVTQCGHFFCGTCALKYTVCQVCQKPTGGIYNKATKLIKKLQAVEHAKDTSKSSSNSSSISSGSSNNNKLIENSTRVKNKWVSEPLSNSNSSCNSASSNSSSESSAGQTGGDI